KGLALLIGSRGTPVHGSAAGDWTIDPTRNSLRLLPSGSDRVGEGIARCQPPKESVTNPPLLSMKTLARIGTYRQFFNLELASLPPIQGGGDLPSREGALHHIVWSFALCPGEAVLAVPGDIWSHMLNLCQIINVLIESYRISIQSIGVMPGMKKGYTVKIFSTIIFFATQRSDTLRWIRGS
ncbi:MAG: hypothetical protein FD153_684, partial [Rhodospirillaceae bacterium]